jgi:hypothetical protein
MPVGCQRGGAGGLLKLLLAIVLVVAPLGADLSTTARPPRSADGPRGLLPGNTGLTIRVAHGGHLLVQFEDAGSTVARAGA